MSISSFHIISLLELLVAIATGVLTRPERKHNYLLPLANEAPHKIFALIGQTVSERKMFENNGHVHGFITPGEGQTIP